MTNLGKFFLRVKILASGLTHNGLNCLGGLVGMKRIGWVCVCAGLLCATATFTLTGCGGNGPSVPSSGYALAATALSPATVNAGGASTSTITVTPADGYKGTITLACVNMSGDKPLPGCLFTPPTVTIASTTAVTSSLTLSTLTNAPNASYTIGITGSDGSNQGPSNGTQDLSLTTIAKIQHIVIIVQENRTPDNLFQDQNLIAAGADIQSSGTGSTGTIALQPTTLGISYDISHEHSAFEAMCDYNASTGNCNMDGADLITPITCYDGTTNCPPTNPPAEFYYVQQSDVQPYFDMAEQYTFGDHMFQTNEGPSFPAHQFLLSGTSEPSVGSNLLVAENPLGVSDSSSNTGCTSPSTEWVATIDPNGVESTSTTSVYPCFEHPTLTDELEAAGVTWRYYAPIEGSIWTAPDAIQHICGPPNSTSCTEPDWANVSLNTTTNTAPILTDIAAGQLQQVSWVIPTGTNSDHAGDPNTTGGPSWVASIVNAIGNSSYWPNTAIIVIWDDWGGWYDHVQPPKVITDGTSWGSGYVYGFRVPLIVISPLAKPAYISKTPHDFGSILKFIENTFNLPSLGFADANALDDLSDCFNFAQTPNVFKTINAPLKADFFLHDKRPPTPPDND